MASSEPPDRATGELEKVSEDFYQSTLAQKDLIIVLLLAQTAILSDPEQKGLLHKFVEQPVANTTKKLHRYFWHEAAPNISQSYSPHFRASFCPSDLKKQFDYLVWDLGRRSNPVKGPKEKRELPQRRFSPVENWIIYCCGLGMLPSVGECPTAFGHDVDCAELTQLLCASPRFPKGIDIERVKHDIEVIKGVFETGNTDSSPDSLGLQPSSLPIQKRRSSQNLQGTMKKKKSDDGSNAGTQSPLLGKAGSEEGGKLGEAQVRSVPQA